MQKAPDSAVNGSPASARRPSLFARFRAWRGSGAPVVPVIRLNGTIGAGGGAFSRNLSLGSTASVIEKAFEHPRAKAVALVINSPGGSPAQSHLIFRRIRQLSYEHRLPVLAFIEDVGASGGYMLACAGDEIHADAFSIVGSIGVVGGGFGFDKAIKKLGIERRLYTAGERKAMLDAFSPEKKEDVDRIKALQKGIHEKFIALVRERRGDKLDAPDKVLFSGEFWPAEQALVYGLIDTINDMRTVIRGRFGNKVKMPIMSGKSSFFSRFKGAPSVDTTGIALDLMTAIETRSLWSRFGL